MRLKKLLALALFPNLLFIKSVYAHCPLCTAGAAVAAGGAAWLGISKAAIGIFIGAFAVSTGWWASNLLTPWLSKKITELRNGKMLPYQGIMLTFALLVILSVAVELIL